MTKGDQQMEKLVATHDGKAQSALREAVADVEDILAMVNQGRERLDRQCAEEI